MINKREVNIVKVSRDANGVGHALARLGRINAHTELWLGNSPQEVTDALAADGIPGQS